MIEKRVLDLNGGLGGRAYAFLMSGFNIVEVIDSDKENCEILKKTIKAEKIQNTNFLELEPSTLPDVDIIMAKYIQQSVLISKKKREPKSDVNSAIFDIISKKKPYVFLLEVPVSSFNNRRYKLEEYMSNYIALGYDISYAIFDEMDFSGFPVDGKQGYFVGTMNTGFGEFEFPESVYPSVSNELLYEEIDDIDSWYRETKLPTENWKKGQWYTKTLKELKETNKINMGLRHENYLVDSIGPRRFTHNELANVKGLAAINYNKCPNRRRMYDKIAFSSNVYVVKAIAERISFFIEAKVSDITEGNILEKDINIANNELISNIQVDNTTPKNVITGNKDNGAKKTKKNLQKIIFPKCYIKEINIKRLKGIYNLELKFEKNLIALMGVNGVGKSTILHALACTNTPYEKGESYKFSEFFTPTPDANWNGSSFTVVSYDENEGTVYTKKYEKKDRWVRYKERPIRDVYYIGIYSCIPEIEREKSTSFINYVSKFATEKHAEKIVVDAAYILGKDYEKLMIHETNKKTYLGVHTTKENITYSALSMGAGEQRVIKLLQIAYNAHKYSMILIDEIDLLLHADAFVKLIEKLSEIAKKKNLQVIFTTHALEIRDLEEFVDIKYLDRKENKMLVYNTIKPDLLYKLNGKSNKTYSIYVEDKFAETIVMRISKDLKMQRHINIIQFGSIENAFTVAAGKVLDRESLTKILIVIDGDKYTTYDEKKERLQSVLSGTEQEHDAKIESALSIITQFDLPANKSPEEYIHSMLVTMDSEEECVLCAKEITCVKDKHDWIWEIRKRMGIDDRIYHDIVEVVAKNENWGGYVNNVQEWIENKSKEV